MNLFLFLHTVLRTSYSLWLLLLCWSGDRLTAGLLAVQKGPHFLCVLHSRFSPQTFTLTRLGFPRCFLSRSSPNAARPGKVSSPALTSSCVPECVWTGSPSPTRLRVVEWGIVGGKCLNIKHLSALLDWLTSYYFTLYSTPCTFTYSWLHTHTDTRPLTQSRFLSGWK